MPPKSGISQGTKGVTIEMLLPGLPRTLADEVSRSDPASLHHGTLQTWLRDGEASAPWSAPAKA